MRWAFIIVMTIASYAAGQSAYAISFVLPCELARVNRSIHGRVVDFTNNHGKDRRIWSPALNSRRDLYVYLPPGYDPCKKYPLAIFLHGAAQDERFFLQDVVKDLDKAIRCGQLPPCIVAAPDGSMIGRPTFMHMATFFANSDAGCYEDYLMIDVWNFLMVNFPIRPEREAHALIGASMGGSAAFTQAIKHRDKIKVAIGFAPALNMRWVDCHGRYMRAFDPECWGWREKVRPFEVVGRPKGIFAIRFRNLYGAEVGCGPDAMAKLSTFNPIEVMDCYNLKPGELDLFVAYGGKDEFNITAQVESFLFRAKERGIEVAVAYDPKGKHTPASARRQFPEALRWVYPLVEPYSPR
jgi:S-formylglutathione hydrolase FrmB